MGKRMMYIFFIGYVVLVFAACGKYEPMAIKGDVTSGQSIEKEVVKEPTIDEIEEAYHRAIH